VRLWRIATETRKYAADDLSGAGAAKSPGRWNAEGEAVVYASPTVALAVLETAAHINPGGLPLNRFLVGIEVPDAIWAAVVDLPEAALHRSWSAVPAGMASVLVGSAWLKESSSAILLVPSVIVPEESVALINPKHPAARRMKAQVVRKFEYGHVFRVEAG